MVVAFFYVHSESSYKKQTVSSTLSGVYVRLSTLKQLTEKLTFINYILSLLREVLLVVK